MLGSSDTLRWSILVRPYGQAERALGRLANALAASSLHPTWLWREITRASVTIAQASGHQSKVNQLRLALIGAPLGREHHTTGLAAAKRVFLTSTPLFRQSKNADSGGIAWPRFWNEESPELLSADDNPPFDHSDRQGEGGWSEQAMQERVQLMKLVRDLAAFADDGQRPALINIFLDLRKHAVSRQLTPSLTRIALPLALAESDILPKSAPGLLGGRRLPLGFSRAHDLEKPLTEWLAEALRELAKEADQSYRRLLELERQHRAWHEALAGVGLRRHAKAPMVLDLLAATPVLSIGMVASHVSCSHVAAGQVVKLLVELGILIEQTARTRHKVYIAGDLPSESGRDADPTKKLAASEPLRPVDVDALKATLDGVVADLERQTELAKGRLADTAG